MLILAFATWNIIQGFSTNIVVYFIMNWLQKISQGLLSAQFDIEAGKIGTVSVEMQCSFEDYDRWYNYKHGPEGWNDRHFRNDDAANRAIEREPDVRLHISHQFSEMMPRVNLPKRTPAEREQMDAFDMVGDDMSNLRNDNFYKTVKIKDVRDTISSWLFMRMDGVSRADPRDRDLQSVLRDEIFGALEELQQQYWGRGGG